MTDAFIHSQAFARDVSVVLPIFNEEESLPAMIEGIHDALDPTGIDYEIVCIDDGSSDRSFEVLRGIAPNDPRLVIGRFRRNFGQTAAMQAGIDRASGAIIVTMDADLQNDPLDIPKMIAKLDEGYDLVTGWRVDRKDAFLNRRVPSFLANMLIARTTGIRLHDYGCSLKVMRAELAKELRLYGEMHRFIPVMASLIGARIAEIEVNHHPRQYGESKYGIGRTVRVTLDLLTVLFLQSYLARPMQVFGLSGLVCLLLGFGVSGYLTFQKVAFGAELADRPLLLLGVILILVGVQLVSLGLVAEVLGRTYHEAQGKRPYHVREWVVGGQLARVPISDRIHANDA
ncbi:MAG: glycosyltransferase family 2 protein [Polyangiales bacterium]|jgi:glycosyltransferase involved in cell wall biosynthesis